jgi:hypothetical protein
LYVGFEAAGQHIGLVPGGGPQGMTSPVAYSHVSMIDREVAILEIDVLPQERAGEGEPDVLLEAGQIEPGDADGDREGGPA